tara:strand:+ start:256 stop:837 length:582 start_codon:yes stop_codon:yes gene_type:complete
MKSKDTKNILLEPLSCLIKLVILSQKTQGTKISIYNNSILFHEPSITQGVLRTYQGDSRDDLHNLCFPIMIALKWYPKNDPQYKLIYEYSIQGLSKLKSNYETNSITNHTLSHYISILIDDTDHDTTPQNPLMEKFKGFWNDKELKCLHLMIDIALNTTEENKSMYLSLLCNLLSEKDKLVYDFVQKVSTCFE